MINAVSAQDIAFIMSSSQVIVNWLNALDQSCRFFIVSLMYNNIKYLCHNNWLTPGAIIRDGDRKSWDSRGPMIWYNCSIFRTNCAILTSHICADPRTCRGLSRGCCHVMWWNGESCEILFADFSQRWQGIRQRRRTRALLCTLMLWFYGKGVFFRVDNFFNFALWMNKIRSSASYSRKLLCLFCREKFCKKTVYSGIELICEFAKIWLIITKTCFDSFLLFLLVCKSFWKAVWRVRVSLVHLHTAVQRVHCPSQCFKIVKKSWKRLVSLSFVLKYYNNFHQRSRRSRKGY